MDNDPTNNQKQIEPTQQAYDNPYIPQNPYHDTYTPIPPPPPISSNNRRNLLFIVIILLGGLIVFSGAFLLTRQPSYQVRASSTPTPTIQPHEATPSPTAQPHDAMAIIQAFQAHNLPIDQLSYGETITQFTGNSYNTVITTQSTATFIDPSFCTGPCGVGSVWLGVYRSSIDAQSEDKGLTAYMSSSSEEPGSLASLILIGHCLLIGEPATSEYAAILRNDCM